MQASPLVTFAIVGGFVAGALGGVLFSPSSGTSSPDLLTLEASGAPDLEGYDQRILKLDARNAALEASIQALRASVRDIEGRQPSVRPRNLDEGPGARRSLGDIDPSGTFSAEEEARFGAYLDRVEQEKEDERDATRSQQREERMERRMDRYSEELGLDQYQRSEMSRVLMEQDATMRDFWTSMRDGGSFDRTEIRGAMTDLQTSTNEQLGQFLNATQMESYSAMDQGGFGGFGRGGGGGRGGSRGGDSGGTRGGDGGGGGTRGGGF